MLVYEQAVNDGWQFDWHRLSEATEHRNRFANGDLKVAKKLNGSEVW